MFNRLRHIYSNFLNSERTVLGGLREWKVNRYGKAIVFVTQDGYRFWQYPGDPIKFNHQRRAVGDSVSVSKYASRFIAPGAVCIDIGSCIGSISVPLWSIIGSDGKLISIEADPDNIARLGANLRLNGYSDRWILNAAVTDADGTIQLRRFVGQNGWQTLGDPEFARDVRYEFVKVKAMRLDTIMADYGLAKVDFIKIDVEGAEPMVLNGMRDVLAQSRISQVLFEVNHLMLQGTGHTVEGLLSFWADYDYSLFKVGPEGERLDLPDGCWPEGYIGDCVAVANG